MAGSSPLCRTARSICEWRLTLYRSPHHEHPLISYEWRRADGAPIHCTCPGGAYWLDGSTRMRDRDWPTGALNCAMYRHVESLEVPPPLQRARNQAGTILTKTVRALTLGHYTEATTYNDRTNHSCIVHAFDIAIAGADRLCGRNSSGRVRGTERAR